MDCRCKGIHRCRRYPVSIDLRNVLRKARRNIQFDPPKLGDPLITSELTAPFVPLTTAAVAVTTQLSPIIGRRPVVLYLVQCSTMESLVSSRGMGGSLPSCARFHIAERGWFSTVPCVRLYIAGGDGSLPSPVFGFTFYIAGGDGSLPSLEFGFIHQGGTVHYRPLCSVLCRSYSSLEFEGEDGVRYPPPVGRVEIKKIVSLRASRPCARSTLLSSSLHPTTLCPVRASASSRTNTLSLGSVAPSPPTFARKYV